MAGPPVGNSITERVIFTGMFIPEDAPWSAAEQGETTVEGHRPALVGARAGEPG